MTELTIKVHPISTDGLPPEEGLIGRVAFLHDGNIFHGWPVNTKGDPEDAEWVDAHFERHFVGVTHWIEFPVAFIKIEHPS